MTGECRVQKTARTKTRRCPRSELASAAAESEGATVCNSLCVYEGLGFSFRLHAWQSWCLFRPCWWMPPSTTVSSMCACRTEPCSRQKPFFRTLRHNARGLFAWHLSRAEGDAAQEASKPDHLQYALLSVDALTWPSFRAFLPRLMKGYAMKAAEDITVEWALQSLCM